MWFDASDVCRILELSGEAAHHIRSIQDKYKKKFLIDEQGLPVLNSGNGTTVEKWFMQEPGLYSLIFKSRKEEAEKFKDWVFDPLNETSPTKFIFRSNKPIIASKNLKTMNHKGMMYFIEI